jgi:hypothetical protein
MGVGTLVSYCPSPCSTAWPLGEIANWTSLVVGLLAGISLALQFLKSSVIKTDFVQNESR